MDKVIAFIEEKLKDRNVRRTPSGFKSFCPYPDHPNHSYTFSIDLKKGFTKCFSCGRFKTLFEWLLFMGADFELASEAAFISDLSDFRPKLQEIDQYVLGQYIPKSMLDRGFSIETLEHFDVGYDPYEKRITIPLYFENMLLGVAYRKPPKKFSYTKGFNRAQYIYNYFPSESRYYVEGFTDTWRVWQNGTKNVSATLGVVISHGQLLLMKKHKNIYLAFDRDFPGLLWSFYVYEKLKKTVNVYFVIFDCKKDGKNDPGNCFEEQWQKRIEVPFFTFEIDLMRKDPALYDKIQFELKKILKKS